MAYALASALVFLWISGRMHRKLHWTTETVFDPRTSGSADIVFVFFDGAFNSSVAHATGVVDQLSRYGHVLSVEYSTQRYNGQRVLRDTHAMLISLRRTHGYRHIVVIGGSLGAGSAIRLATLLSDDLSDSAQLSVVGIDAALGSATLPGVQSKGSRGARYVHPGLVCNALLAWLPRTMIGALPLDQCESQVEAQAVDRHSEAMKSFRLSAMLDMIVAIADFRVDDYKGRLAGVSSVYLRSGEDDVLDGDQAYTAWRSICGDSHVIDVPVGRHLTFVEHPSAWSRAFDEALHVIGVAVEQEDGQSL